LWAVTFTFALVAGVGFASLNIADETSAGAHSAMAQAADPQVA
jgi:hypothetical protein